MDTYGRMGNPFLNFLKDVAAHTALRASGNVNERTQAIYDSIDLLTTHAPVSGALFLLQYLRMYLRS